MEKFEVERYEEDEIDLVDLLKTIIKGKNIVIITTILSIILSSAFIFYKNNKAYNYGVNIILSEETTNKLKNHNSIIDLNKTIEDTFITLTEDNTDKNINTNFQKIIDSKNKNYKLFSKIKKSDIDKISTEIYQISNNDLIKLNHIFNQKISNLITIKENDFKQIKKETEILNEKILFVIKNNFENLPKENLNETLSIVSPFLYIEYKEKITSLNLLYSEISILNSIHDSSKNFLTFTGENAICLIDNSSKSIDSKIILILGIFLGIFLGMFIAIVKDPLKNIINDVKKEN